MHLLWPLLSALLIASACSSLRSSDRVAKLGTDEDGSNLGMNELESPSLSSEAISELMEGQDEDFEFNNHPVKFCRDDIYASYLRDKAYAELKDNGKEVKSRKRRASLQKQNKLKATFYAGQMLDGPALQYFGGLPVAITPKVESWVNYYKTDGREQFMRWLVRSQSHRDLVVPLLQKDGLPKELFFLAMIESGFSNTAYSRARATGTWQFMKATARSYGLTINHWVDERRDPIKSTMAASRYLKDLYEQFHDWYLAIAAYNAGPGKIRKAVRLANSRDYWALAQTPHLSQETKEYVPKMLAAIIIASNPQAHGFSVVRNAEDETPKNTVDVKQPARLSEVAQRLHLPPAVLKKWNPELVRDIIPPPSRAKNNKPYALRLPETLVDKFKGIEESLTKLEIKDVLMHKVAQGETISSLARKYRVEIKQILSVNPDLNPSRLKVGREIAIPIPAIVTASKEQIPT